MLYFGEEFEKELVASEELHKLEQLRNAQIAEVLCRDIAESVCDLNVWQQICKDPKTRKCLDEFEQVMRTVRKKHEEEDQITEDPKVSGIKTQKKASRKSQRMNVKKPNTAQKIKKVKELKKKPKKKSPKKKVANRKATIEKTKNSKK